MYDGFTHQRKLPWGRGGCVWKWALVRLPRQLYVTSSSPPNPSTSLLTTPVWGKLQVSGNEWNQPHSFLAFYFSIFAKNLINLVNFWANNSSSSSYFHRDINNMGLWYRMGDVPRRTSSQKTKSAPKIDTPHSTTRYHHPMVLQLVAQPLYLSFPFFCIFCTAEPLFRLSTICTAMRTQAIDHYWAICLWGLCLDYKAARVNRQDISN